MRVKSCLFLTAVVAVCAQPARAAILYTTPASVYTQNFDTLGATPGNASLGNSPDGWKDDDPAPPVGNFSIEGFYLHHRLALTEGGFNGNQRLRRGPGNANVGAFMSYGPSNDQERALGVLNSDTLSGSGATNVAYVGARFTNNTGVTLSTFTVSYTGEQWRDGGAATPNAQQLSFSYKLEAASIQDTGYTAVSALDFVSPVFANTGAGAAVNGNAEGSLAIGPVTITGITWLPGEDLWIRWGDNNNTGNDHGLAIDDLSFSANVPEPGTLSLAGLALAGLMAVRRQRQ